MLNKTVPIMNQIYLADSPAIPGLIYRRFEGESDYPKMVAVLAGCKEFDQIERAETLEDIQFSYSHLVNSDPFQDMVFAEYHSQVLGYNRVNWRRETDGNHIYQHFGFLIPAWRRKGIGLAMMREAERRIREIASSHPDYEKKYFESFVADTEVGAEALLKSERYVPIRHEFSMVRPDLENIPDCPLPGGLEIRPVREQDLVAVRDASAEAFRDHWGYSEDMEPTIQQLKDDPNYDPTLWRVAWDGDQVAGMVLGFVNHKENVAYQRKRGYTENICTRKPWRRKGLAHALIAESLRELKRRGYLEAALGVDSENLSGALGIYESMGFQVVKRFSFYRKPLINN